MRSPHGSTTAGPRASDASSAVTPRESQVARALVGGQFLLLGLWVATGHALATSLPGQAVQALGCLLAGWAFAVMILAQRRLFRISPDPTGHTALVRHGPYRWIRHPMYTSILLLVGGSMVEWRTATGLVLLASLGVVLWSKLDFEERLLLQRFPDYADYRQQSWRLFPMLY